MTEPVPSSAPWWTLPIAIIAIVGMFFVVSLNTQQSSDLAEVRAELDALAELEDQIQLIAAGNSALEVNDATLAEWAAQVSADIRQLQIAVIEQPERVSELVGQLNDRLDDLARLLTTPEALSLLDGVQLSQYDSFLADADLPVGGPSALTAPSPSTTTSTTTSAPPPTTSEVTAAATEVDGTVGGRVFRPEIEQWRDLATEALTWAGAPWAVDEMLEVIDNESDGCPTAAAYNGCPGVWLTRAQTGSTGCGARGLVQTCTLFWEDWATRSGLAECVPLEKSVDARCNLFVGAWLFVFEGCDWQPWESTRPSWRRGHC